MGKIVGRKVDVALGCSCPVVADKPLEADKGLGLVSSDLVELPLAVVSTCGVGSWDLGAQKPRFVVAADQTAPQGKENWT